MNDFFLGLTIGLGILAGPTAYLSLREIAYLRFKRFATQKTKQIPKIVLEPETANLLNEANKLLASTG